jgi:hypothetical protein
VEQFAILTEWTLINKGCLGVRRAILASNPAEKAGAITTESWKPRIAKPDWLDGFQQISTPFNKSQRHSTNLNAIQQISTPFNKSQRHPSKWRKWCQISSFTSPPSAAFGGYIPTKCPTPTWTDKLGRLGPPHSRLEFNTVPIVDLTCCSHFTLATETNLPTHNPYCVSTRKRRNWEEYSPGAHGLSLFVADWYSYHSMQFPSRAIQPRRACWRQVAVTKIPFLGFRLFWASKFY